MTTENRLHTPRYLYRFSLAAAIIMAATAVFFIILGWTLLFGSRFLSISTFLSIATVVILISGVVYILLWMTLSYRSLTADLRAAQKVQKHGTMTVPAAATSHSRKNFQKELIK